MRSQPGLLFWGPFGSVWGPFGVHLGSMWAVGQQSELVTPSGKQFDPLGPILEPSWTPCRPHVGPMLEAVGRLRASWSVLEPILRLLLINIEQKMKRRGWIFEKSTGLHLKVCLRAHSWRISGRSTAARAPWVTPLKALAGAHISALFVLMRTGTQGQHCMLAFACK